MRRIFIPDLRPGHLTADASQSRHVRTVLRLGPGDHIQAFDAAGRTADATVVAVEPGVVMHVEVVVPAPAHRTITVASAVPKGDRADWMVEKLCEIGVGRLVPLRTARSVVHPEGHKIERWRRIAVEAAKQSRRVGVLDIGPLTNLHDYLPDAGPAVYFSTRPGTDSFVGIAERGTATTLLIGPEGGWTDDEESAFQAAGLTAAGLGRTILRIETAAVLAAGLTMLREDPA